MIRRLLVKNLFIAATCAGFVALMLSSRYPEPDAWGLAFLVLTSGGLFLWFHHRRVAKWFLASIPWWVMSQSGWLELGAAIVTLLGFIALAVGPTLPGRRRDRNVTPLPELAGGPLSPVTPRAYQAAKPSRALSVLTIVMFCLTVALGIASAMGAEPEIGALALSSFIIAVTFAFSSWFSGRMRLRIDEHGLHSRALFRELTIPWNEVAGITIRYVYFPGMGMKLAYYVTYSPTNEFAFTNSMKGNEELRDAIQSATGLTFPEPEFTSTI